MLYTYLTTVLLCAPTQVLVSPKNLVIESAFLNTHTEVQIHLVGEAATTTSIVYLTDGEKLLEAGFLDTLQELYQDGEIPAAYYVFVSSVDLLEQVDKRNTYFFCNENYLQFFEQEVIPQVETLLKKKFKPTDRALLGISFGGLNAAWFTAKSSAFKNYALLSPVTYPCPSLISDIQFSKNEALRIFLSTGVNDAENYVRPLQAIYKSKGFQLLAYNTRGGHDFDNWMGQLPRVMNYFFT